jgi:2-keto-4-pentenoate hydratase/2-oxohepta-3-ene-1,7-dioic acid hydratase in catechol pathway
MKLVTYWQDNGAEIGLVDGTGRGVIAIGKRMGVRSIRVLLDSGRLDEASKYAAEKPDAELALIELLPVIPDAAHFYCVGVNYADHLKEVQEAGIPRPAAKFPALFIRFNDTLCGHRKPMVMPKVSNSFDYEAELAIIIGKGGRYIDESKAMSHIAGYSCFNDGSVRDWQFHTSQVTPGKNFSGTGGFGPWMVTTDEIPNPSALDIKLKLNGTVLQHSNTNALIFGLARIVAYCSAMVPLLPGDVIATGTPGGVGFSRKPPIFMKAGDVCEVEIEGVGTLRNPIVKEQGG